MPPGLDHVFIGCTVGAPEAEALSQLGLIEGPDNQHPGQGTACRRFFFANAYLELVWVSDAAEAQAEPVQRTTLYERLSDRDSVVCPFGVVLRSSDGTPPPFASWTYTPPYVPAEASIEVACDVPLTQPALFCLISATTPDAPKAVSSAPRGHGIPIRELTDVRIALPGNDELAPPAP